MKLKREERILFNRTTETPLFEVCFPPYVPAGGFTIRCLSDCAVCVRQFGILPLRVSQDDPKKGFQK